MQTKQQALIAIVLGLLLFLGINLLIRSTLGGAKADLTEDRLFTLTAGSKAIAKNLGEPVALEFYFSRSAGDEVPQLKTYAERVQALLEEFARSSNGKLTLRLLDPEPFSEVEDQASAAGLRPLAVAANVSMYMGLVGRNSVGETERIPFFDPRQERFLEYEVAKLLSSLDRPDKTKVGVLSSLPVMGGGMQMPGQRPEPGWLFVKLLSDLYEVEELTGEQTQISSDIDVLVLIHPRELSQATLYAIDQYALAGRPLVAFVDGFCEGQPVPPEMQQQQFDVDKTSSLGPLLPAWGLKMVERKLAGDRKTALQVNVGSRTGAMQAIEYLIYLSIGPEQVDATSPVTAELDRLIMASAGIFEKLPDSTLEYTPLIRTSEDSQEIDLSQVQFGADPSALLKSFVPGYRQLDLAVQLRGKPKSAFPEGRPAAAGGVPSAADLPAHLSEASGEFNAILIGDADLLADRFWTQSDGLSQLFGTVTKSADNADFLLNSIELLAGDENLIRIRARGRFERPFTRVDELARAAEQKYRDQADRLDGELRTIQARLQELETQRPDQNSLYYTPEQEAEIKKAMERKVAVNKELRAVQYNLNKDVKRLGDTLMYANILGVPLLVACLALYFGVRRRQMTAELKGQEQRAKKKAVTDQRVISGFAFAGGAAMIALNVATGVVPGGAIGGGIGGALGAFVGMIVNSLRAK
jgi:ABC-type uncharacterized transport system involved in gliding motility auxiliary subunit